MPRVGLISLGGTIAMVPHAGGGVVPALSAAELLAAVPGLSELALETDVHDFRRLPGASLGFPDLLAVAAKIDELVASGVDGVVVTQGTDTIEETAYLLDLLHAADAPVVVTGAMRSATAAGADGPANLLAALRVAASTPARGLGALVVFADEIHAARFVRKAHTTSIAAFTSYPGPVGYLAEDQVRISSRPPRQPAVEGVDPTRHVRTALATITLADDGELLRVTGEVVDGIVISALGAGHVPQACVPVLADLVTRIPVVLASRTGAGPVLTRTYGFPGSESDLLARGLISAGGLHPHKARVLLQLLLMAAADRDTIENVVSRAAATV